MMSVREVKRWLDTLDPDECVGVDEGGLTLVNETGKAYLEVGGLPDPDDDPMDFDSED